MEKIKLFKKFIAISLASFIELRWGQKIMIICYCFPYCLLAFVFLYSTGSAYKFLRFYPNSDIARVMIVECTSKYISEKVYPGHTTTQIVDAYQEYHIKLSNGQHVIKTSKISKNKIFDATDDTIDVDFCSPEQANTNYYEFRNGVKYISVHSDRKSMFFEYLFEQDKGHIGVGILMLIGFTIWMLIRGSKDLTRSIIQLGQSRSVVSQHNGSLSWLTKVNESVLPISSIVLTGILTSLIGFVILKGVLFTDLQGSLLTGILVTSSIALIFLSPGPICLLVYQLKSGTHEILKLIRNLFLVFALIKLIVDTLYFIKLPISSIPKDTTLLDYFINLIQFFFKK